MTRENIRKYTAVAIVLAVIVFLPLEGRADDKPGINHYIDGTEDYDAGMYDSALKSLGKAIELGPSNLDYQYYYAMTYNALGRYQEAESIYSAILNIDPKNYYKAYFDLAAIYTKKKDYKKALKTISAAEWIIPDNARLYLERGTIQKKMKRYKAAVENYKRALELDKKLSQTVNYNIGLVYYSKKHYRAAKKMFQLVISENPDNKLAEYARLAIGGIKDTIKIEKPWKVSAYASYSYDDNISEDPLDRPWYMKNLDEDKDGQYQVFYLKGDYRLLKLNRFQCSTGYIATYLNFNDSENENSFRNSPYFLLRYNMKPFFMSLHYDFSHYFADSDESRIQHTIIPSVTILEPYNMKSVVSFSYQMKDYKSDAPTEDVNIWTGSLIQYLKIPEWDIIPRIGIKYGDEDSDSVADTYSYIESSIGIESGLPFSLTGDLSYTDIRTDYKKTGGIKREDTSYLVEVAIRKALTKSLSTKLYYGYIYNKSNTTINSTSAPVYSYDPYKYDGNHVRLSFSKNF